MSFDSFTTSHVAAAVSTGAAGYGLYRFGDRLRQFISPLSGGGGAARLTEADDDDEGSNSLVLTILQNRPKNMDHQQVRAVIQFVKDTIAGRPLDDKSLAVCSQPYPSRLICYSKAEKS